MSKRYCNYCNGEVQPILSWFRHVKASSPCNSRLPAQVQFAKTKKKRTLLKRETHVIK